MPGESPYSCAVFAKSLLLLNKMRRRLRQLDDNQFPTETSSEVKRMLLKSLDALQEEPKRLGASADSLYKQALEFQDLVDLLERSSSEFVSCPTVSFCNKMWGSLFPQDGRGVFFSYDRRHNYGICSFSRDLRERLKAVLPTPAIDRIVDTEICCLSLASLEEDNIPMYACIAHEFGHEVYKFHHRDISRIWLEMSRSLIDDLGRQIESRPGPKSDGIDVVLLRKQRLTAILERFAKELTADLFGALLIGHSSYFSLNEMAWNLSKAQWNVTLPKEVDQAKVHPTKEAKRTKAYPSFDFRAQFMSDLTELKKFLDDLNRELGMSGAKELRAVPTLPQPASSEECKRKLPYYQKSTPMRRS